MWQAKSGKPQDTDNERQYIIEEARRLFKKNKRVSEEQEITQHILEAEARLNIAIHYKNPYPRPVNVPPMTFSSKKGRRGQQQVIKQSRPVYVKSIDKE